MVKLGLFAFMTVVSFGFVSYKAANSYFADTVISENNTFATADEFSNDTNEPPIEVNPGDVVINEVMWMGTSVNAADEWIELRNLTNSSIDLSNWVVENLGSDADSVVIPVGKSIAANGYFLIANDTKETGAHDVDPDFVTNVSIKNNPSEQLRLKTSPTGVVIDVADNESGGWLAGVNGTGQNPNSSMERNDIPGDGTISTNWHTATSSVNIDSDKSDIATPRAQNSTP